MKLNEVNINGLEDVYRDLKKAVKAHVQGLSGNTALAKNLVLKVLDSLNNNKCDYESAIYAIENIFNFGQRARFKANQDMQVEESSNILNRAGMLCEHDDLTRDMSGDYAILDELKKLKKTYFDKGDFYWWDGCSGGKYSTDKPLGTWDSKNGKMVYILTNNNSMQMQFEIKAADSNDPGHDITIGFWANLYPSNKRYFKQFNSLDDFEEFLQKRRKAIKQKKTVEEYDKDQDEWIETAHENESTKINDKNMNINEARRFLKNRGYRLIKENT